MEIPDTATAHDIAPRSPGVSSALALAFAAVAGSLLAFAAIGRRSRRSPH